MLIVGIVVIAAVLLMSRTADARALPNAGKDKVPDNKAPSNAGIGADPGNVSNTMKDVMSGIGAGVSVATAGIALGKAIHGLYTGGVVVGEGVSVGVEAGSVAAEAGSVAAEGGTAAGTGIGAGLAAAAPGLIAQAVVLIIIATIYACFTIQHASATLNQVLMRGKRGAQDRMRFMVWQLEDSFARALIEALGGHVSAQDYRGPNLQEFGNQQTWVVTGVSGLAPDILARVAVISRVMAIEQTRGFNLASMQFFASQYNETASDVEAKGFALDDQSWVQFVAMYYSQNHTTPYGGYLGAGFANNYVQALAEGPIVAHRLKQAIFSGQCQATKFVKLVQGQFAPYTNDDTAAANAANPPGTPLTAHYNFAYFNGLLRQSGNHLVNDGAALAFDHNTDSVLTLQGA